MLDEVVIGIMMAVAGVFTAFGIKEDTRSTGLGIFSDFLAAAMVGLISMPIWAFTHVTERETGEVTTASLVALDDVYLMEGEYQSRDIYTFRTQIGSTTVVDQAFQENSTVDYSRLMEPQVTYIEREKVTDWPFMGDEVTKGEGLFEFIIPEGTILPAHGVDAS